MNVILLLWLGKLKCFALLRPEISARAARERPPRAREPNSESVRLRLRQARPLLAAVRSLGRSNHLLPAAGAMASLPQSVGGRRAE